MSLISFTGIVISLIVLSMIFLIIRTNKKNANNKPNLFSILALGLIVLNWLLYLLILYISDSYIIIPGKIGEFLIFLWFIVSIIGLLSAYKEFRNNNIFAFVVSGLAIINAIVGMLLWGIGNM